MIYTFNRYEKTNYRKFILFFIFLLFLDSLFVFSTSFYDLLPLSQVAREKFPRNSFVKISYLILPKASASCCFSPVVRLPPHRHPHRHQRQLYLSSCSKLLQFLIPSFFQRLW